MSDVGSLWTLQTFLTNLVASAFFAAEFFIWRLHFQLRLCMCVCACVFFWLAATQLAPQMAFKQSSSSAFFYCISIFYYTKKQQKSKNLGNTIVSEKLNFLLFYRYGCACFLHFFFALLHLRTHLRGLGYLWQNFAVYRETWMQSGSGRICCRIYNLSKIRMRPKFHAGFNIDL